MLGHRWRAQALLPSGVPAQSQRVWKSWKEREMCVAAAVRKGFLEEGVGPELQWAH